MERRLDNSWVTFSAAFRDPEDTVLSSLKLTAPDGSSCDAQGNVEQLAGYQLTSTAVRATPFDTFGEEKPDSACITSPYVVATVDLGSNATVGTPIELRVVETPAVTNLDQLPEAFDGDPSWTDPATGKPTVTQGGTSFDDAPTLVPGSYADSIVQGETLTYQVQVDWGQQLNAQVTLPELDASHRGAAGGTPIANLRVYNPGRGEATSNDLGTGHNSQLAYFGDGRSVLSTVAGPVRVKNVTASSDAVAGAGLDGLYTVVVFVSKQPEGKSIPVPFRLDLGVSGTVEGAPEYADPLAASGAAEPSEEPTAEPSDETRGELSDEPSGSASGSSSSRSDDGGGFPVGGVLGGLAVLAIAAGAGVYLKSRSKA
ncbi:hypothetical protein J2X46_004027 [Nocardioides sp. BE266]|uniref:hypothetical protein n=1 Tax=Nocardioides sp. BE266 TaxID=2817725 RepID=UPI002858C92F|nr:hypothetical protein [Nocardioides sp. BE266]MDR7255025.1 hypothetical protein [Nocardioides sp. BE266]